MKVIGIFVLIALLININADPVIKVDPVLFESNAECTCAIKRKAVSKKLRTLKQEQEDEHFYKFDNNARDLKKANNKWQSPIDLSANTEGLHTPFGVLDIQWANGMGKVENTGHNILISMTPDRVNLISRGGMVYALVQFHYHYPSETTVSDAHFKIEAHYVHLKVILKEDKPEDYCSCADEMENVYWVFSPPNEVPQDGDIAVVGQVYTLGRKNKFLSQFFSELPPSLHEDEKAHAKADDMKMIDFSYLQIPAEGLTSTNFWGSLTTPPYTPGLDWYILNHVFELSPQQYANYRRAVPEPYARDTQPKKQRKISDDVPVMFYPWLM